MQPQSLHMHPSIVISENQIKPILQISESFIFTKMRHGESGVVCFYFTITVFSHLLDEAPSRLGEVTWKLPAPSLPLQRLQYAISLVHPTPVCKEYEHFKLKRHRPRRLHAAIFIGQGRMKVCPFICPPTHSIGWVCTEVHVIRGGRITGKTEAYVADILQQTY